MSSLIRWLLALVVTSGCTAEFPVACNDQMGCPSGFACTQNVCVRSMDMALDMSMCVDCDGGGGDLGDASVVDAQDLEPMCTAANVKLTCTDPSKPICSSDTCAACTGAAGDDTQCNAHMNGKPRCDSTSGTCVACRANTQGSDCTTMTAPICDANHTCRGCVADAECTSGVCEFSTGACIDATMVALVDHGGTGVAACNAARAGAGMQTGNDASHAWCDVQTAINSDLRQYLLVKGYGGGAMGYSTVTTIGRNVTLVGPGAGAVNRAVINGSAANPAVSISSLVTVVLDGLELTAGATGQPGINCSHIGSTLVVRNSLVDGNSGPGIISSGCLLTVTASTISGNTGGQGILASSGTYNIFNNFIFQNALTIDAAAVDLGGTATGQFYFNTVANNGQSTKAGGISCSGQLIEESIVWGNQKNTGTQLRGTCTFLNVVTDTSETSTATGLIKATPVFVNAGSNDYRLDVSSPANVSTNKLSVLDQFLTPPDGGIMMLPPFDYFGTQRPQNGGFDIGAHEAKY